MTGYTGAAGQLTRRQRQVFALVRAELSCKQIAARLGLDEEVVTRHVAAILARVNARQTDQAATAARRTGGRS